MGCGTILGRLRPLAIIAVVGLLTQCGHRGPGIAKGVVLTCDQAVLSSPGLHADTAAMGNAGFMLDLNLNASPSDADAAYWRQQVVAAVATEDRTKAAFTALQSRVCGNRNWKQVVACADKVTQQVTALMSTHPDVPRPGVTIPADVRWRDAAVTFVGERDREAVRYAGAAACVDQSGQRTTVRQPDVGNPSWRHCVEDAALAGPGTKSTPCSTT